MHIVRYNINNNNWGWNDKMLNIDQLYKYDEIKFIAKIQIIDIFDKNGNGQRENRQFIDSSSTDYHYKLMIGFIRIFVQRLLNKKNIIDIICRYYMDLKTFAFDFYQSSEKIKFETNGCNHHYLGDIFSYKNLMWMFESINYESHLKLLSIPDNISQIFLYYKIFSCDLLSSMTGISVLDKANLNTGSFIMTKDKSKMYKLSQFSFQINILKITDHQNHTIYEHSMTSKYLKNKYKLQWNINKKILNKCVDAYNGERFESERMINGSLWSLGIAPNGNNLNEKGNVIIFLQLCCLPTNIYSIEIDYILMYNQEIQYKETKQIMNYHKRSFIKWPSKTLNTNKLIKDIKRGQEIIINAHIIIRRKWKIDAMFITPRFEENKMIFIGNYD